MAQANERMVTKELSKHPLEDIDSWQRHLAVLNAKTSSSLTTDRGRRHLSSDYTENIVSENDPQFWDVYGMSQDLAMQLSDEERDRLYAAEALWVDPGINSGSVHGFMIDAGSSGSRLHIFQWHPRVLRNEEDMERAVAGEKLSFPGTESRWTDRLQPGISSFAGLPDIELHEAIAAYLAPLLTFAKIVLHEKRDEFATYPIYFRATSGMRIIDPIERSRVISVVRKLFANKTYCPFEFVDERARVLSGEEEAVYGWAGVNFLLGDLLQQSDGVGNAVNPRRTHGALDLGGGSTQIGFYEPHEDIMSGLFKLQIGQNWHWNVYGHSFLMYGMNAAIERFVAKLVANDYSPASYTLQSSQEIYNMNKAFSNSTKLANNKTDSNIPEFRGDTPHSNNTELSNNTNVRAYYNPCLPGGSEMNIRTAIHINAGGTETWDHRQNSTGNHSADGSYDALLKNDNERGDPDHCFSLANELLHLEKNEWCDFSNKGNCSLAGVYQPNIPARSETFGDFIAWSNYRHVWHFLHLPDRATLYMLEDATRKACNMTHAELIDFDGGHHEAEELKTYCFRSAYVFQLLRNGYGFQMNDAIQVTKVIKGQKVGWPLGAMMYEINTLPWQYEVGTASNAGAAGKRKGVTVTLSWEQTLIVVVALGIVCAFMAVRALRQRHLQRMHHQYQPVKDVNGNLVV